VCPRAIRLHTRSVRTRSAPAGSRSVISDTIFIAFQSKKANCNISRILSPRFRGGDHLSKRPEPGTDNAAGSGIVPYLALLRKGLAMRPGSLRSPVVSYTAVSPLPSVRKRPAVCSLLRFPSRGVAPATSFLKKDFLPCGVRTFLFARQSGRRCSSRFYYIMRTRKMQIIFVFFRCGNMILPEDGQTETGTDKWTTAWIGVERKRRMLFRTFFVPRFAIRLPA